MTAARSHSQKPEDDQDEDKVETTPAPDSLVVDVKANLTLPGVGQLEYGQTGVTVPDTAEVRDCLRAGYLTEPGD